MLLETPVGVLNFDFGEERVETLAPGIFIFGQPGLEQTPEAKPVAHTRRDVTVRTLVRLAGDRCERISEIVEIHLGEVKFVGARAGESLSQALLRKPEGEVPKNRRQAHFDQPLRDLQISETASVFAVYSYRAALPVLDCGGKHRAQRTSRKTKGR